MNKISTKDLNLLPNPIELQRICKSISVLEAVICQEWQYRYYSYQRDWSKTEEFCEMRNGEGDQMLILFANEGTCLNGFAHESALKEIPKGVLEDLPELFHEFIYGEPVKSIGTTFCIWQTKKDVKWKTGNAILPNEEYKDGSSDLLQLLDGKPSTYKNWAEEYYEIKLEQEPIEKVFNREVITKDLVLALNPKLEDYEKLKLDLREIGYEYKE